MTEPDRRISGEVTVYQPIVILELDEGGMRIEAAFALHNDSLHEFRIALRPRPIVVKGRVVRCEIGDLAETGAVYRCAVEFVEPAPHALTAIRDFVASQQPPPPPRIVDGEIAD